MITVLLLTAFTNRVWQKEDQVMNLHTGKQAVVAVMMNELAIVGG